MWKAAKARRKREKFQSVGPLYEGKTKVLLV